MLTIWNPGQTAHDGLLGCYYKNFFPFDIEKKDWLPVKNIQDAEFIALQGPYFITNEVTQDLLNYIQQIKNLNLRPDQKLLILNVWHIDDRWADRVMYSFTRKILQQEIPNEFAIIHTNFENPQEIQYDFLWNRQKIYFTNYNYIDLHERTYTLGTDARNFQLGRIEKYDNEFELKKFLCPNRIYKQYDHPRIEFRKLLRDFVEKYHTEGYYSDPQNGKTLDCENSNTNDRLTQGGWYPISNAMYNKTFFSIYTETLTGYDALHYEDRKFQKYKSITEKTWDPLIKGHFILPFGYPGLIDHIRSYGFKFPDWIDYSYDMIEDNNIRFECFLESAEKLMKYSKSDLMNLYEKDRDILVHNREVFWSRPYDSLHDKVIDWFDID